VGFKVDTSFLKFLTMGARGTERVIAELTAMGFRPIELERYCTSNKIWATKVKRLRLPDLICVQTGLRLEVRAKSALQFKMSDAPNNPDRAWDAGLRDEDVVALIACTDSPAGPVPADRGVYVSVAALRASVGTSALGPPKSASEGAERDRTWPATVPKRPGHVVEVSPQRIVVVMDGDGAPPRRQTFTLNGKHPYVGVGDNFSGGSSIIAGTPATLANLQPFLAQQYDPVAALASQSPVDRYAGAKALRFRDDLWPGAHGPLSNALKAEVEPRVALEIAGTLAAKEDDAGRNHVRTALFGDGPIDLSMEAILILTEIADEFARGQLREAAQADQFGGDERRQAAIWGLGKAGLKSYADLLTYIADADENVAFHAIAAFGNDAPRDVVQALVALLDDADVRKASAASEALRVINSQIVVDELAANAGNGVSEWSVATLGRLSPDLVRAHLKDPALLQRIAPMLLIAQGANWLATEQSTTDLSFLLKQDA